MGVMRVLLPFLLVLYLGCPAGCSHGVIKVDDDTASVHYDFCPTKIDVFGYSNVANVSCGGYVFPEPADPAELAVGYFEPGNQRYAATLAGMLQDRILLDDELIERFGEEWLVRSCSTGGALMRSFVDNVPEEPSGCELPGGSGNLTIMCSHAPAPLALYVANNVSDWCHGGGTDSPPCCEEDDPDTYAEHWVMLLEEFVQTRPLQLLLVSPQHEWHGQLQGSMEEPQTCEWLRPEWNRLGQARWTDDPPQGMPLDPLFVGDMQDEFKRHHPCCEVLQDVDCDEESWFLPEAGEGPEGEGDGWTHFGCDGAEALADFWFDELKAVLTDNEFTCP